MRTTIELSDAQRAELLKLAGARGEKGFSSVIRDAVDLYLKTHAGRGDAVRAALGVRGALAEAEGTELQAEVAAIRRTWR